MNRRDVGILLLIAVAFGLLARGWGSRGLDPPPLAEVDRAAARPAPGFDLPALGGGRRGLASYAGRVLFLNFWATWCEPCREELPILEALHAELGNEGLAVVAVSLDKGSPERVERFVARHGVSFEVLHDPEGRAAEGYGVWAHPTSAVVDRSGKLLHVQPSAWDWSHPDAVGWLRELLAGSPQ